MNPSTIALLSQLQEKVSQMGIRERQPEAEFEKLERRMLAMIDNNLQTKVLQETQGDLNKHLQVALNQPQAQLRHQLGMQRSIAREEAVAEDEPNMGIEGGLGDEKATTVGQERASAVLNELDSGLAFEAIASQYEQPDRDLTEELAVNTAIHYTVFPDIFGEFFLKWVKSDSGVPSVWALETAGLTGDTTSLPPDCSHSPKS
ncbi:hypothetical protein BG015_011245 [Linnemannia schmuckeri]|uniref:Uncharacterized protein n=1 Tax=Linnemannia schmuckeri TaxID=64567 RepID=A0A9P5RV08_9FUNG|nr:hypothetical protein BG015_011245 [Linnemannia schmuckeri]